MAKWHGTVGYVKTEETSPGIYSKVVTERSYYGDIIRNIKQWSPNSNSTNDDLTLNAQFSIVADSFVRDNIGYIKYVVYMGTKWKITSIDPQPPRLILTVGGVYNG